MVLIEASKTGTLFHFNLFTMRKNFQQKLLIADRKDRKVNIPTVADYMTRQLITFRPDTHIIEVIESLLKHKITGAPVLNEENEVVGLIDDKDCLRLLFADCYYDSPVGNDTVEQYTTNVMKTISIHSDIVEAANLFLTTPYKRFLVMDDDNKLAGIICRCDILRAIRDMETHVV
jgi:predicted transcriptional regulator